MRPRTEKLKEKQTIPRQVYQETGNVNKNSYTKNHLQARQPQNCKSRLRSRNVTQVASAVSTAHPSASQPGPINPIRRDMRCGARGKDTPRHRSSINSGRCHVMCKATIARPHSKNSTRAANMPCTMQHALTVVLFINENAPPPKKKKVTLVGVNLHCALCFGVYFTS